MQNAVIRFLNELLYYSFSIAAIRKRMGDEGKILLLNCFVRLWLNSSEALFMF